MYRFHNELTKLPLREQFKIQTAFYIVNKESTLLDIFLRIIFFWKKGTLLVLYYLIALHTNVQMGLHSMKNKI